MSKWCEFCRDHFDSDHFEDGMHLVGNEYGPEGAQLLAVEIVRALAAIEPLVEQGEEIHGYWDECGVCGKRSRWAGEFITHYQACAYRRAVEWVEAHPEP